MATFTWVGGSNGNNASDPANWFPSSFPGANDTLVFDAGSVGTPVVANFPAETLTDNTILVAGPFDTLNFNTDELDSANVTLGAGGVMNFTNSKINVSNITLENNATLSLTGSGPTSMEIDENQNSDQQSIFMQAGASAVVNINGTVDSQAFFLAAHPGGTLTLNIAQGPAAVPGLFYSQGPIIDVGETIDITGDANTGTRFGNNGLIFLAGVGAAADVVLTATMTSLTGGFDLVGSTNGATLEIATNVPGSQNIIFGDGNGTLQIDATTVLPNNGNVTVLADFFGRISGFQTGDDIVLDGISTAGLSWTYGNNPTYGTGVLELIQNSTTIALLRISGQFVDGTGSTGGANSTDFAIVGSGGNTTITLQQHGTVASFTGPIGGTIDWGTTSNWTGGSGTGGIPGQFQTAEFNLTPSGINQFLAGSTPQYQLNVSSAETVGGVVAADPFTTLDITAALTLAGIPGQSGGGVFNLTQGTVDIGSGGVLSTTRFYEGDGGKLTIDAGGSLNAAGVPNFALGGGVSGVDIESNATISGGIVTTAGNFVVGQNDTGSVTLEAGGTVTDSYTAIGGQSIVNPFGTNESAFLDITGATTTWKDAGGDSSTPYSGGMLVGGGAPSTSAVSNTTSVSVGTGGAGFLQVDNRATLIDTSFAIIGVRPGSTGGASVTNGAQWLIGTDGQVPLSGTGGQLLLGSSTVQASNLPYLTVGLSGAGNLFIGTGGTVALTGNASDGGFKMTIGEGGSTNAAATGNVNVDNGLLNLDGGVMDIGLYGHGSVNVTDGATVEVGAWGTINYGIVLGRNQTVINSVTQLSTGVLTVGGGTGTSLFTDTGDFDDGRDGAGTVDVNSGGSLHATGTLFIGGNGGATQGAAAGDVFNVSGGGTASVAGVRMWAGNTLSLTGQGNISVGSFSLPLAGQLDVAVGSRLLGAGLITVSSNSSQILNNGLVEATLPGATLELNAVLALSGGTYQVGQAGTIVGAIMKVDQTVSSGTTFNLGGAGALSTLIIATSAGNFHGTINNFLGNGGSGDDTIDLPGISFASANPSQSLNNGTLTINSTAGVYSFPVTGSHAGGFVLAADTNGGTEIIACFAAGTRILTETGERGVEALEVGDRVPTLLGAGLRRIKWIGHTTIDLDRHRQPEKVAPVRVRAHAFGPDMPHRDLILSPDHAVAVAGDAASDAPGTLMPIHLLVNGGSIAREPATGVVTYFHVELDSHDVLLAEGLPAESYLDTGNRGLFAGEGAARALHPNLCADLSARAWDERSCAPLLLGGSQVLAVHRRLAERATALGHGLTDDPGLRLIADGTELAAEMLAPGLLRVVLPAGAAALRLLSRSAVPEELDRRQDDRRRLGVALAAVTRDGAALSLDGACCGAGFHAPERDKTGRAWRWTDGAATLKLRPEARDSVLELRLVLGWRQYRTAVRAA